MNEQKLDWIRCCASAGEALPPEIYKKWKEKTGLEILDGIGSTEALHIFISNRSGEIIPGTSGKPVPGYEVKILDDNDKEVGPGETGHLIIRGTSITPGYWRKPEENERKFLPDGWFRTGDMYSQQDGYFTYQGRGDDMLKAGGLWVSPVEIEYALLEHEAVNECAVVGQEIEGLVKPFAYVVLNGAWSQKPNEELSLELLDFLSHKLPKFKRPWGVNFVDDLPKTATGKIQRFKLRG
jgi:acyl-coenzyme A synthetase/AMP-(fatty) acid ligase